MLGIVKKLTPESACRLRLEYHLHQVKAPKYKKYDVKESGASFAQAEFKGMYKFTCILVILYISDVSIGAPNPQFSDLDLTVVVPNDKIALHFLNRNYNRKMKRPSKLNNF